jgi:hypothetical protein
VRDRSQDRQIKNQITCAVKTSSTTLTELRGIGFIIAAKIIGEVGDLTAQVPRDAYGPHLPRPVAGPDTSAACRRDHRPSDRG